MTTAYDEDLLIGKFVGLVRELGRFPVSGELRLKARTDAAFPSLTTFSRLGGKPELTVKIIEFCKRCGGYEDVIALCESAAKFVTASDLPKNINERSAIASRASTKEGCVYMGLLTLGREKRYKIGKAVLVEQN